MIDSTATDSASPLRAAIDGAHHIDESACIESLLARAHAHHKKHAGERQRVDHLARTLVSRVRAQSENHQSIEAFLQEYNLSSQEGTALMCLAEALLRIPDSATADRLIRDKLSAAQWGEHLGRSPSLFVNASTWGLMLTGKVVRLDDATLNDAGTFLNRTVARIGEPLVRLALTRAMRILGQQFVMGTTIEAALQRARNEATHSGRCSRYSFDMLGEAALTEMDAAHYFERYATAIDTLAAQHTCAKSLFDAPGISIKLSALHPRYEFAQRQRVINELAPKLLALAEQAMAAGISLTVDAEEWRHLSLSLDLFAAVFRAPRLHGWEGFGLAVQAYHKNALALIDWLAELARSRARRIPLRLVKGAYWDSEIKQAQLQGLPGYPVFTRKASTDLSYLVCARHILAQSRQFYAQFATHNAHTMANIMVMAEQHRSIDFEFQRLHGMGEELYGALHEELSEKPQTSELDIPCRVYAPVGNYKTLLPYLVRRLLENGANTSFVHRITDRAVAIEQIVSDPLTLLTDAKQKVHPRIPLPPNLFGAQRINAAGLCLDQERDLQPLQAALHDALSQQWSAQPIVGGHDCTTSTAATYTILDPADQRRSVGNVLTADAALIEQALSLADSASPQWNRQPASERAASLQRAATLLESHRAALIALCIREGGKTIPDALAELREAVDFCRYYAAEARNKFAQPIIMPGPTGEHNELTLQGRGIFICISPWNFPLAIFVGQIAAALAAGNAVIAKPASQTPLVAALVIRLLHQAGIPGDVLHYLPGSGTNVGNRLVRDPRIAGVAFTGASDTAHTINRVLAERDGPIIPFIAETGGQNAMIVDSSALTEQVVIDTLHSAFNSAGQRCSALRVLFLQKDNAAAIIKMLQGAMAELRIGDPAKLETDIGPIIDANALKKLKEHVARMREVGTVIYGSPLPDSTAHGHFFAPCAFEIDNLALLKGEVFGPILHIITYPEHELDRVIAAINHTGYGLTLGIHSRINERVDYIRSRVRGGNIYVNRNIISAVVGVQPFGGQGLSGTGPKAGGPHYLQRFANERTLTVNTAAVGGNADLLALNEDNPVERGPGF
ncbi:MAG: bifunctional proline dehydrogenase/L-glutamate gamma-semialdehyde dehydrogenase PutA [Gammaproteobacteria bacterium]|nr:bifunctional proline dehydrogenase/L-glutamate gamma-semialdehyde dehydrogenase PutA [Gammaproteobacteria bacterium]